MANFILYKLTESRLDYERLLIDSVKIMFIRYN